MPTFRPRHLRSRADDGFPTRRAFPRAFHGFTPPALLSERRRLAMGRPRHRHSQAGKGNSSMTADNIKHRMTTPLLLAGGRMQRCRTSSARRFARVTPPTLAGGQMQPKRGSPRRPSTRKVTPPTLARGTRQLYASNSWMLHNSPRRPHTGSREQSTTPMAGAARGQEGRMSHHLPARADDDAFTR